MAGMHMSGKLFSGRTTASVILIHAGAIQRLRDEEAAAVEAEDFERAADLSAVLDAAGRDAGTAAAAAREAEAACESASQRRLEVSNASETGRHVRKTRPRRSSEHRRVHPILAFSPMCG